MGVAIAGGDGKLRASIRLRFPMSFKLLMVSGLSLGLGLFVLLVTPMTSRGADRGSAPEAAARAVLERLIGSRAAEIRLAIIPAAGGNDVFETVASNGVLTVRGSSPVALDRGFYDYLKSAGLGIAAWTGDRVAIPAVWPDAPARRVVCPYEHRYYLNVVTYGYTMPYWTWERWERELDWMALHGINMPLALVGTEAIGERVWQQAGLTPAEIASFYTGPAHLPWQRMGNVTGLDGPLPAGWNADQVVLQHRILARMRELGMTPIVPAFGGFVPPALKRLHPEIELHELDWAGFPKKNHAWLLAPDSPLFAEIGRTYVQEWEKEFGPARYFLADSFNEMQLPKTGKPVTELLADYGGAIYRSIAAGDPQAVWAVQGWMFGYQRDIWNRDTVKALGSRVPDDRMLILDLANDYNGIFWNNGANWEQFDGYFGKPWVYSVIPNMGGKTAYTGVLDFYATDPAHTLASAGRGRETGFGFAPEGIENNEVIYELLSDVAWQSGPVKLDDWVRKYCTDRYGACPPAVQTGWDLLRQSCYGTFTDHPRFGWQTGGFNGSVNHDPKFFSGVESLLAADGELGGSPLYRADAIEMASIYLGLKADEWFRAAKQADDAGDAPERDAAAAHGLELLTGMDRLLESHPIDRLERWLAFARAHGTTAAEKDYYEENARRLVTVWGPPINDYSARIWSGLIRDFYRERMARYFAGLKSGQPFARKAWEEQWVRSSGVSPCAPFSDPVAAANELIATAKSWPAPPPEKTGEFVGDWTPAEMATEWKTLEWRVTPEVLRRLQRVIFQYAKGAHRLDVQWVALVADGKELARDDHYGYAGKPSNENVYRLHLPAGAGANNDCLIRARVRSDGGTDSHGQVLWLAK